MVLLQLLIPLLLTPIPAMEEYRVGATVSLTEDTVKNHCFQIRYRANYKPMTITLSVGQGVEQYIVTDSQHPTCDQCSDDAKYCLKSLNSESTHELTLCNEWVYVNFRGKQVYANVTTYYNTGWPCEGIDRNPHNYCQLMSGEECVENCNQGCSLVHCLSSKSAQASELFSMCLPSSTPDSEITHRCQGFSGAKTFAVESCRIKDAGGLSVSWVIFLSLAIPSAIFFVGNVVYYRCAMNKRGRPPFDVPDWCPQALYPRRAPESMQRFATG